jgi:hypothetical protein
MRTTPRFPNWNTSSGEPMNQVKTALKRRVHTKREARNSMIWWLHVDVIHDTNRSKRIPTKIPLLDIKIDFQRLLYFHKAKQWNATITLRDSAISICLLANLIHGTNRSKRLQEKKPFNTNHNKHPIVALFSTLLDNEMQSQNCQTSWYRTACFRNFDARY